MTDRRQTRRLRLMADALLLGAVVAVVAAPRQASACSCVPPVPPLEALDQTKAVFVGEVVQLRTAEELWVHARIEVSEVWKGDVHEVVEVRTHSQGFACGYAFEEGRAELVYAVSDGRGRLTTNLCARTTPLASAREDLVALGSGSEPLPGSSLIRTPRDRFGQVALGAGALLIVAWGAWAVGARSRRRV